MENNSTAANVFWIIVGVGLAVWFFVYGPRTGHHVFKRQTPKTGSSLQGSLTFGGILCDTLFLKIEVPCRFRESDSAEVKVSAEWSKLPRFRWSSLQKLKKQPLFSDPSLDAPSLFADPFAVPKPSATSDAPPILRPHVSPDLNITAQQFELAPLVSQTDRWSWALHPKTLGRHPLKLIVSAGQTGDIGCRPPFLSGGNWKPTQICPDANHPPEYVPGGKDELGELIVFAEVVDDLGLTATEDKLLRTGEAGVGGALGWVLRWLFRRARRSFS